MIAVIDLTGDGWGFVGHLHRIGYEISWVVGADDDVGFDALPAGFRGIVHRVGFGDRAQLRTAVRACGEILFLANPSQLAGSMESIKGVVQSLADEFGLPCFLVSPSGGGYEVMEMGAAVYEEIPAEPQRVTVNPTTLLSHVG